MQTSYGLELLEWNEENFSIVLSDLFRDAESDPTLHAELLSDPFEILSTRIAIPEEFRGGIFSRENGKKALFIRVPSPSRPVQTLPEGTLDASLQAAFVPICTVLPVW